MSILNKMVPSANTMLAAVLYGPNDLRLEYKPIPKAIPGSIILKVDSCAICGSDLRIIKDGSPRINQPRIIGHEVSGTVIDIGEGVSKFHLGDRLSVGADVPCGHCNHCLSGYANNCDKNLAIGYQFDGGLAEFIRLDPVVVDSGPVQKFSNNLTSLEAALAEPLGCCIHGFEVVFMTKGASVAIFGAGPIGILLLKLAKALYSSNMIIVIEPHAERRKAAVEHGADLVINPLKENPVDRVLEITAGAGVDRVFTACAVSETHETAIAIVAKRGFVNLFGGVPVKSDPIPLKSNWIHYREAYITGSHGSTPKHHARALELIDQGLIDMKGLITREFPLSQIHEALETANSGVAIKVLIRT